MENGLPENLSAIQRAAPSCKHTKSPLMMASPLKYRLRNEKSASIVVIIEPWAEEISVPPDKTLEIVVFYPSIGPIETITTDEYIIVWLWGGCRATVSLDGQDCTPGSLSIPAPR
jgi:hypothetical protein